MKRRNQKLLLGLKLALGLGLLGYLLVRNGNWRQILDIVEEAETVWLAPFLLVSLVIVWVSCVKWQVFLRGQGSRVGQIRLFVLYLIGRFFNNFLPSSIGGDVMRSYLLGRHINSQGKAAATVFLERLTGFVAMVTLALGAFLVSPELRDEPLVIGAVAIMGGGCLVVIAIILKPELWGLLIWPFRRVSFANRIAAKAERFHSYLTEFKGKASLIAWSMALSYAFYVGGAVNVYFAAELLAIDCSFVQLLVVTPIVMLLASLPLTPNGIGIWEWGFSVFLVSAGATPQEGLAIALAIRTKELAVSLIGGVLFLFERPRGTTLRVVQTEAHANGRSSSDEGDSIPELRVAGR